MDEYQSKSAGPVTAIPAISAATLQGFMTEVEYRMASTLQPLRAVEPAISNLSSVYAAAKQH